MANPNLSHIIFLHSIIFLVLGCGSNMDRQQTLIIAAAANMQFAMEELTEEFTSIHGVDCDVIISSSGKHTAQILEGAPYDIFLSADTIYPQMLSAKNKSLLPSKIYAFGHLVVWSGKTNGNINLNSLAENGINHIAIANPKTAPYGRAAQEVLINSNLLDQTQSKLVYGENIAQTNQFIISGAADIGITAKSAVLAPSMQHIGSWLEIDSVYYDPIPQAIMVLNTRPTLFDQAKMFYEFIFSANGKEILDKFGYSVPNL